MKQTKTEPTQEELNNLESAGWIRLDTWQFFKAGKVYDLSAADLTQLERIEKEGLFVVAD